MSYRTRRRASTGREYAQAHIQAGIEFSDEVGEADVIVKNAFFSLSSKALGPLLDKYEALYGTAPRDYAQQTIPKWRSGKVHMSGLVAKRLFDLMPPLMPLSQKNQIVEKIWKHYGPYSKGYLYVGPDVDRDALLAEIEKYFASLDVMHEIPEDLEDRFDWISSNDVTVKQQLLNYFIGQQRKVALASAKLNLGVIIDQMNAESAPQIKKLSHTAFVGNHQLEIKADRLRNGFLFSNSDRHMTRPKATSNWKGWLVAAGIIVGFYIYLVQVRGAH